MNSKFIAAIAMVVMGSTAAAETYVVSGTGQSPVIATAATHAIQTCIYADKAVQPGDTVVLQDTNIVMVCAKGEHGAVFLTGSGEPAKNYISLAKTAKAK